MDPTHLDGSSCVEMGQVTQHVRCAAAKITGEGAIIASWTPAAMRGRRIYRRLFSRKIDNDRCLTLLTPEDELNSVGIGLQQTGSARHRSTLRARSIGSSSLVRSIQVATMKFRQIFLPLLLLPLFQAAEKPVNNDKCKICQFLVQTFQAGLSKTARDHFGGGDTAWEEKNLGKYATSETRLVEIHESLCKKKSLDNTDKFNGLSELEFKCAALLEENEEVLEDYYYNQQEKNMEGWLCSQQLRLCCPDGHFGPDCSKCPAVDVGAAACFGHGQCHGDGSRTGSGKCKCDAGYVGNQCRHCEADYFEASRTDTTVDCQKCYEGCAAGCTAAGPLGCNKCRSGWEMKEGDGCIDIDECVAEPGKCTGAHEKCTNLVGTFSCDCVDGYKKEDSKCVIDFVAQSQNSTEEEQEEDPDEDYVEETEKEPKMEKEEL